MGRFHTWADGSPACVRAARGRAGAHADGSPRAGAPRGSAPPTRGSCPYSPLCPWRCCRSADTRGRRRRRRRQRKTLRAPPPNPPPDPPSHRPPRTAPPLRTPPRERAVNGGGRSRVGAAVHVEVGYSGLGGSAEPSRFSQSGPGSLRMVPVQPLPSQFNQYGPSTPSAIPLLPLRSQFSQYRVPSTVPVVIGWSQFNPVPSQFNQ